MKKTFSTLFSVFLLFFTTVSSAQNNYQKAWDALNNAEIFDAISLFEQALESKENRQNAQLCLTLLYSQFEQPEKAATLFQEYLKEAKNPLPALYSLWFEQGVAGMGGAFSPYQYKLLKFLEKNKEEYSELASATSYRLLLYHLFKFDKAGTNHYLNELDALDDWQLLGPFDNAMNSGYNKDFGALNGVDSATVFSSQYGTPISWFTPPIKSEDGYFFKEMCFYGSDQIVYAQTFVESPENQEILLRFGYSGTLKVWINDVLIYANSQRKVTEVDYYKFKCTLQKGNNRILVQLGDFDEPEANFIVRLTDQENRSLSLKKGNAQKAYAKTAGQVTEIPYFALSSLKEQAAADPDHLLNQILLVKALQRSFDLNEAEHILLELLEKYPNNYFALLNLIKVYELTNQETNYNKYFELFESTFPYDNSTLQNKIDEYFEEGNKDKTKEYIDTYLRLYPSEYGESRYSIIRAILVDDTNGALNNIKAFYEKYPDDLLAVSTYVEVQNAIGNNPEAIKALEGYTDQILASELIETLGSKYIDQGDFDKAITLFNKVIQMVPYGIDFYRFNVNLYTRQAKYKEAIEICKALEKLRPSDYRNLEDLAKLHTANKELAIGKEYYQKVLQFFPFSYSINEKLRELNDQPKASDLISELDPIEKIREYENDFSISQKYSSNIVYLRRDLVIYQSKAQGSFEKFILQLNDEEAIENFQHRSFSSEAYMSLYFDEIQTIKKNGQRIDADRSGGEVVFTNLEVGDYIYVSIRNEQTRGGKSALFINDIFDFDYQNPIYQIEYHLHAEGDLPVEYAFSANPFVPEITKEAGFTQYTWRLEQPTPYERESNITSYYDVARVLHIGLDQSWTDVVQWYADLSSQQAEVDLTIKRLVKELFKEGETLTDRLKAERIYNFVLQNIQYSYVDFRQSGFVPQKASVTYNNRLGDCKDVSTLFVTLAREVGLTSNLVLIKTTDNGRKSVIMPSLDFNHCIVKVYIEGQPMYLELTDTNLPFGYLSYIHEGASILEIPVQLDENKEYQLSQLEPNEGFFSKRIRKTEILIQTDGSQIVNCKNEVTGIIAGDIVSAFYNQDTLSQKNTLWESINNDFQSEVTIQSFDFSQIRPRAPKAVYNFTYRVDDEIIKMGTMSSLKVQFSDLLISMNIFSDQPRKYPFDWNYYEDTEEYDEIITIKLPEGKEFMEIPEKITADFQDNHYDIQFKRIDDQTLVVERKYICARKNIDPEDFEAFKAFAKKISQADLNTYILYK